jgi:hypothetical protein
VKLGHGELKRGDFVLRIYLYGDSSTVVKDGHVAVFLDDDADRFTESRERFVY